MIFPINQKTATLVVILLLINLTVSLAYRTINPEISDHLFYTLKTFMTLFLGTIILFLRSFSIQISGTRSLNIPLLLWLVSLLVHIVFDLFYFFIEPYGLYKIYISFIPNLLYALVEIILIVKIFILPAVPYRSYFRWFAGLMAIHIIVSLSMPFLTGYLADRGFIDFEKGVKVEHFVNMIVRQPPFVALLMLFIKFIKRTRAKEFVQDSNSFNKSC